MVSRFLIRAAQPPDASALFRLARFLDSYNLPADRRRLARLIEDSRASFAGRPPSRARERYLFVLEDGDRVVGSSLIVAQHGTPGLPHLFLDVFTEVRRSRTLRRAVSHPCLRLGWTESGPTELGGLVLLPAYRGHPAALGRWLSYSRLLFIAAHRRRFRNRLLAEFLPVFLEGGRSPFWEYLGRRFTGLSYKRADRLSIDNKEFIVSLFPSGTLYTDLFPAEVLDHLGKVGNPSRPAARLLGRLGFRYSGQIEPFDGGPYYEAATDEVPIIGRAKRFRLNLGQGGRLRLLLAEGARGPRLLMAPAALAAGRLGATREVLERLGCGPGDWVWSAPVPP